MAIRKLLLPLTGTAAGEAALSTALMTARLWNAHVSALHVRVNSRDVAPLAGEGLSGAMIEEMMSATEKESSDRAHAVRAMFERFAGEHEVIIADARPGSDYATASFAAVTGREEDLVAQLARLADLTVVPHPDAGEDVSSSDALHAVLFDSGRPVLIAPQIAPASIGTRICVAWNGTAEIRRVRMGGATLDAAGGGCSHSVGGGISAPWASRHRSRGLPSVAWHSCRDGHVPHGQQQRGRRAARGGARVPRRPSGHGRLFAFPPAATHFGRRHPARSRTRYLAGDDEPLRRRRLPPKAKGWCYARPTNPVSASVETSARKNLSLTLREARDRNAGIGTSPVRNRRRNYVATHALVVAFCLSDAFDPSPRTNQPVGTAWRSSSSRCARRRPCAAPRSARSGR